MSEYINNREYRKNTLKSILTQLHEGKTVDEVKGQFAQVFEGVSAEEISQAEQALIQGGLPVTEVQRLCDVHAEVFKGSIEEIHRPVDLSEIPGHPVNILKRENQAIQDLITQLRTLLSDDNRTAFVQGLDKLYLGVDIHYKKKENLMFPYMEQYGITAPPKVMWGVDDEIREMLKALKDAPEGDLRQKAEEAFTKALDMIFKEENILLPILLENLTQDEWKNIADESIEFGYCLIDRVPQWKSGQPASEQTTRSAEGAKEGVINLPTGIFTLKELECVLNTLPVDISFVGKDDTVRYFSQNNERIFPRTPSVIGRNISNCHPPASVHVVEKLVNDFKSGVKTSEDFWIRMGNKYVLIRYFAVHDTNGEYLGVLEVTQNIAPIQNIKGEKRMLSD
ncbi:MAG: Hemerythrin HHE cation binding domain protein [Firmicutes bacterium ADurb.Bin193]|nr:MAG: Hemerythrin HHE cation binding domain protein [Firmicutes bacterium ADurb.Bin193]